LAIVVIFKDEAPYIEEWAQFHLDAGAAMIIGYDNGSVDGTADILCKVAGGRCKILPWVQTVYAGSGQQELHNQVLAYVHAASNFGGAYRWISFIDVDEFLVPTKDDSIPAALAHLDGVQNISLPWHMFGRGNHEQMPDVGTARGFTERHAHPGSGARGVCNFKSIADPCALTSIAVHALEVGGKAEAANDKGVVFANKHRRKPEFYSNDRLQLNHYYTRSAADLQVKIDRGLFLSAKLAKHGQRILKIVDQIESDTVQDRAALDFLNRMRGA